MSENGFGQEQTRRYPEPLIPIAEYTHAYTQEHTELAPRTKEALIEIGSLLTPLEQITLNDGYAVGRETIAHSIRTSNLAGAIAAEWRPYVGDVVIESAITCGLAHDIGKSSVAKDNPELLDPRRQYNLAGADREIMGRHTKFGSKILRDDRILRNGSDPTRVNLLPEAIVALMHHDAKRLTVTNNGYQYVEGDPEDTLIGTVRLVQPELTPDNMRRVLLSVSMADMYDAITSREYVPPEHLPETDSKKQAVDWILNNIDGTRIGLTGNDMKEACLALIHAIEKLEEKRIPSSVDTSPSEELLRLRRGQLSVARRLINLAFKA